MIRLVSFDAQVRNRLLERVKIASGVLSTFVMLYLIELVSGAVPGLEDESHLLDVFGHGLQMTAVSRVHDNFTPALREGHHVSGKITIAFLEIYLYVERIVCLDSILAFSVRILRLGVLHV